MKTCRGHDVVDYVALLAIGRDSGQVVDAFKLLKMFVKGKGAFQFKRPHDYRCLTPWHLIERYPERVEKGKDVF